MQITAQVYDEVDNGTLRAGVSSSGTLFNDVNSNFGFGKFTYSGDSVTLAFASNLWVKGTINNSLSLAANTYLNGGRIFPLVLLPQFTTMLTIRSITASGK